MDAMKGGSALVSYRDVFADVTIYREKNVRDEYALKLDFAISLEKDGWYACLHGLGIGNIVFFCYTKFKK